MEKEDINMFKATKMLASLMFLNLIGVIILRGWYLLMSQLLNLTSLSQHVQKLIIFVAFTILASSALGFLAHEIRIAPIENEDFNDDNH